MTRKEKNDKSSIDKYLNIANIIILALDDQGQVSFINRKGLEVLGCKREEIVGFNWFDNFILPGQSEEVKSVFQNIITGRIKNISHHENLVLTKNNKTKLISWRNSLLRESGKIVGTLSSGEDITEERQLAEALEKSEEKYSKVFNQVPILIGLTTLIDNRLVEVNDTFLKTLGYKRTEVVGHTSKELNLFVDYGAREIVLKEFRETGRVRDRVIKIRTKKGKIIEGSFSLDLIVIAGQEYLLTIMKDITERESLHRELRRQIEELESERGKLKVLQAQNEAIIFSLGEGVIVSDLKGRVTLVNDTFSELTGLKASEVVGQSFLEVPAREREICNDDNLCQTNDKIKASIFDGITIETTWWYCRKDGSKFLASSIISPIHVDKERIGNVEIFRDITEERSLEQAKTEFLAMTSHQLRTPLSAIRWTLESLGDISNLTLKQQNKVNDIIFSNERLISLVNKLLNLTRIESGRLTVEKRFINLVDLLNKLKRSFEILADKKEKTINITIPPDIDRVYCDPFLLSEVMENLLSNAINYSLVSSRCIDIEVKKRKEDYLITIHNEGFIDKTISSNIFQKFVRGPEAVNRQPTGSGLGLYIAKKVTEANGGEIWFESGAKSGTIFYITIPKNGHL